MNWLFRYVRISDKISELTGWLSAMIVIATVIIGVYNVAARYIGRFIGLQLSSNLFIELQWYMYSLVFFFGFAYILKNEINVRVDFIYANWPRKRKAMLDFWGNFVFLIPFCIIGIWMTISPVMSSWGRLPNGTWCFESQGTPAILYFLDVFNLMGNYCGEISPDPSGLNRAPIKSMIIVAFGLLLMQAIAEQFKLFAILTDREEVLPADDLVDREEPLRIE